MVIDYELWRLVTGTIFIAALLYYLNRLIKNVEKEYK